MGGDVAHFSDKFVVSEAKSSLKRQCRTVGD